MMMKSIATKSMSGKTKALWCNIDGSTYHRHSFRTQDWGATIRKGRCQHLIHLFMDLMKGILGRRMMIKTLRRANMMRCSIQMPMLMTELNRQKDGLKSHWPGVVSG